MTERVLIFVSPHPARRGSAMPSRPAALLNELVRSRRFDRVVAVNRVRPDRAARAALALGRSGSRLLIAGPWVGIRTTLPEPQPRPTNARLDLDGSGAAGRATVFEVIEHPWPYGYVERRFLQRLVSGVAADGLTVLWISDPKSASVFEGLRRSSGLATVFDAYDAWDLSPLVRGRRRLDAVRRGYSAAAARADMVFANTNYMRQRFESLGAARVMWLPNACLEARAGGPGAVPYLAYVGRIHERFDVRLTLAVADALTESADHSAQLRVAGPVERVPNGWDAVVRHPAVRLEGPLPGNRARELIAAARALIVPHTPDDYTRSQDTMKAWDALAAGVPVISTSVPPADTWPAGLAVVCDDPEGFAAAAMDALAGRFARSTRARIEYAKTNTWRDRANSALDAILDQPAP